MGETPWWVRARHAMQTDYKGSFIGRGDKRGRERDREGQGWRQGKDLLASSEEQQIREWKLSKPVS